MFVLKADVEYSVVVPTLVGDVECEVFVILVAVSNAEPEIGVRVSRVALYDVDVNEGTEPPSLPL